LRLFSYFFFVFVSLPFLFIDLLCLTEMCFVCLSHAPTLHTPNAHIYRRVVGGGAWKFGEVTMTMANESVGIRRYVAGFDM